MDLACMCGDYGLCQMSGIGQRSYWIPEMFNSKNYTSQLAKVRDTVKGHLESPIVLLRFFFNFLGRRDWCISDYGMAINDFPTMPYSSARLFDYLGLSLRFINLLIFLHHYMQVTFRYNFYRYYFCKIYAICF